MIAKQTVIRLVEERIEELDNGLFIVEARVNSNNVINVELDKKEGGVTVDDCIRVSRNVEHNLDREQQDFELHVSSAGLDKPLRVAAQYEKNIGRQVKVKKQDNTSEKGELIAFDGKSLTIRQEKKVRIEGRKKKETVVEELIFRLDEIRETTIVLSFK